MTWEPAIYEKFRAERARPFHDLLALVEPAPDMDIVDLGCGTGELTQHMHAHLRARSTLGLDSSPMMLARTCPEGQALPTPSPALLAATGLRFALQDIAGFDPGPRFDLVLSNAALHWLPDHHALLGRLTAMLRPGGQLAVQIPSTSTTPATSSPPSWPASPPTATSSRASSSASSPSSPPSTPSSSSASASSPASSASRSIPTASTRAPRSPTSCRAAS
jgi:trans-aconitate methyltransferase